jgi:chloride channel 7
MGAPDDPAGMGTARDFAPSSSRAARSQHRVDKVRLMEEGSRTLQRHAAETLGAALDAGKAERAHARLKRMAAFDSHDYDPADNDLEEEALRARTKHDYKSANRWKWGLSVMIGVTMGFVAFTVDGLIDKLNAFKYGSVTTLIDDGFPDIAVWLTFVCISASLAAVAGGFCSHVEPLAAGSGIPEMKTYLNGVHLKGLLRLRTVVAKLGGIAFSIGSGLIAGKEGPFVHGGGLVGGGLSAFGSHSLGFKTAKPNHFRNDADKRDFIAIGTAAGVAVAFGAPIGGCLFAVEEGASFYSQTMLWRGFLATCMGVLTIHWLDQLDFDALDFARAKFGTHRDFGLYTDDEANYSRVFWWYFWEVPLFAGLGALGGLLGALFVKVNVRITAWRQRHVPVANRHRRHAEVILVCAATATVMFLLLRHSPCAPVPANLRVGSERNLYVPKLDLGDTAAQAFEYGAESKDQIREKFFRRLYCPEGAYSLYGQLFFTPLAKSLKLLVHLGEVGEGAAEAASGERQHMFGMDALFLYFFVMYGLMILTYGVGAPTGLFVPSLAVGAALGQIYGRGVAAFVGAVDPGIPVDLHTYAVLGAAASLGGATRMTISITVLVMETTGSMQLIIPLMLVIFFAKAVGDKFSLGIYDTHIKIRGAPFLIGHEQTGPALDKLRVSEVMADDLVTLEPTPTVSEIVAALTETSHGAFPVAAAGPAAPGAPFELHGTITRGALLKLLQHRVGFAWPGVPGGPFHRNEGSFHRGVDGLHKGDGHENTGKHDSPRSPSSPSETAPLARAASSAEIRLGDRSPVGGGASEQMEQMDRSVLFERVADRAELIETLKQIPFKAPPITELVKTLTAEELAARLDIRPFMQRHPFIVHADARLSRAYRLFRTMGLRHMYITPSKPQVVGVVTRKDLSEENAALTLGERAADAARDSGTYGDGEAGVAAGEEADAAEARNELFRDRSGNNYDLPFLPYYPGNVDEPDENRRDARVSDEVLEGGAGARGGAERRRGRG